MNKAFALSLIILFFFLSVVESFYILATDIMTLRFETLRLIGNFLLFSILENMSNIMILITTQIIIFETSPRQTFYITTSLSFVSVLSNSIMTIGKARVYYIKLLEHNGFESVTDLLKLFGIDFKGCHAVTDSTFKGYGFLTKGKTAETTRVFKPRDCKEDLFIDTPAEMIIGGKDSKDWNIKERYMSCNGRRGLFDKIIRLDKRVTVAPGLLDRNGIMNYNGECKDIIRVMKHISLSVMGKETGIVKIIDEFEIYTPDLTENNKLKEDYKFWSSNEDELTNIVESVICMIHCNAATIIDSSVSGSIKHSHGLEISVKTILTCMYIEGENLYGCTGWYTFAGLNMAYDSIKGSILHMSILAIHNKKFFGQFQLCSLVNTNGGLSTNRFLNNAKLKLYKSEVCELSKLGYLEGMSFKCRPYKDRVGGNFNGFIKYLESFCKNKKILDIEKFDEMVESEIGVSTKIKKSGSTVMRAGIVNMHPIKDNQIFANRKCGSIMKVSEVKNMDVNEMLSQLGLNVDNCPVFENPKEPPFENEEFCKVFEKFLFKKILIDGDVLERLEDPNCLVKSRTSKPVPLSSDSIASRLRNVEKKDRSAEYKKLKEISDRPFQFYKMDRSLKRHKDTLEFDKPLEDFKESMRNKSFKSKTLCEKSIILKSFYKTQVRLNKIQQNQCRKNRSKNMNSSEVKNSLNKELYFTKASRIMLMVMILIDEKTGMLKDANKNNIVEGCQLSKLGATRSILRNKIVKIDRTNVADKNDPRAIFVRSILEFTEKLETKIKISLDKNEEIIKNITKTARNMIED